MELALHIADFTWTGGATELAPALIKHVRDAEGIGVRRISVMDHFWQIRGVGPAENEMLEAYSALGFIAAHTEHSLLHTLVTGVTYREPALLAKAVTTLNVLSGGRVGLGIGAAWNDEESEGLGFDFPPTAERFERLEETVQICQQMWSGSEEPFEGKHYQLTRTLNSPQALSTPRPYLMIGGSGEKKTLRLVAQYADACNIFGGAEAAHKLDVLRGHCESVGRDYDEIDKTTIFSIDPSSTVDDIVSTANEMAALGFTSAYIYATGITEPGRVIDLFAAAMPRLD
ncbi:LLM class F420-dependent oxidoreductase [Gordonia sp. Z-3]|uniref:LLM class F420-dependent oxidoreductase n=1 Tax=Gordonia sp. Z-3 TaxID=3115408 RepID=UPI002E2CDE9C|nr:LLM class F420-dependent oxidoreductase [Gordonia sp. Z-3]MED5803853.1 LLM class F420-dependent oxidoreductase [Gordonia sp. Z-3]